MARVQPAVGTITFMQDAMWDEDGDAVVIVKKRTIPGLTAYEIAVDKGFPGTEQEWCDYMQDPTRWMAG